METDLRRTDAAAKNDSATSLRPPQWVSDLLGGSVMTKPIMSAQSLSFTAIESANSGLLSVRVADAVKLNADQFADVTSEGYELIARYLKDKPWSNPVRFWNHIPDIHANMGDGLDRYMTFNAGRHRAFVNWYGETHFEECSATASGVGHKGSDLVIHCFATTAGGSAVGNPRQVPPYLYSRRFGPLPPCFARATMLPAEGSNRPVMLVGGTASVRGEDSVHRGDLHRQALETFENLGAIIRTILPSVRRPLDRYRDLRVYVVHETDVKEIRSMIAEAFGSLRRLEITPADLCRSELLLEIEGIAEA